MRIGIVTLYGLFNYGNRLQNYALQEVLKELGNDPVSFVVQKKQSTMKTWLKQYIEKERGKYRVLSKREIKRNRAFRLFTDNNIKTQLFYTADGRFPEDCNEAADLFVVGSDQVWNPAFWMDSDSSRDLYNYLLSFTEKRRIAYAASFGISEISNVWKKRMKKHMEGFSAISVRELSGIEILNSMGLCGSLVIDPTLLLDVEKWRRLESGTVPKDRKYVLYYFLGEKPAHVHGEEGFDTIDLMDEDCKFYTSGPDTFLELIDKAETVYTDSFHAVVFSLIFHTPFAVYNRVHRNGTNMGDRVKTLLSSVGIEEGISVERPIVHRSFENVDEHILTMAKKSKKFIEEAIIE